ncbi:hypothetical protein PT277_02490 [Acetobacteraceae bacterium ESL0709]|nr:hypothetical protein [Acetobacteraceae bacterium ESL0697]MDF7677571.1 hypothetical protein [Acetobacteraceae bacterium ESL0709]
MSHIPQTYVYVIILLVTATIHYLFPQLSPLLKVMEGIWLVCIIVSGLVEYYLDRTYGKTIGAL